MIAIFIGSTTAEGVVRSAKVAKTTAKAKKVPAKPAAKLGKAGKVLQAQLVSALKQQPKTVQLDARTLVEQWGQDLVAVDATYGVALIKLSARENALADLIIAATPTPVASVLLPGDGAFRDALLTQLPPGPLAGPAMAQMAKAFGLNTPNGNETKSIGGAQVTASNDGNGNVMQTMTYSANEPAEHGPIAVTQDFSVGGPINPSADGTITLNIRIKSSLTATTPTGNWIDEREVTGIVVIRVGDNQTITDAQTTLRIQTREGVGADTPYTDATIKTTLTNNSQPGPNGSTELRWGTNVENTAVTRTSSTATSTKSADAIANAADFAYELITTHLNSIAYGSNKARLKKPKGPAAKPAAAANSKNGSGALPNGLPFTMLTRFHVTFHDMRDETSGPSGRVETQTAPVESYGVFSSLANTAIFGVIPPVYIPWESVDGDGKPIKGKNQLSGRIEGTWTGTVPIPPDTKLTITLRNDYADDLTATITLADLQSAARDDLHFELSKNNQKYSVYLRIQGECTVAIPTPTCGFERTAADDEEPATPLSK
jgi:hypothetical protein